MRIVFAALALLLFASADVHAGDQAFVTGGFTENVVTTLDPAQTYTLYLPSTYSPAKRWPLLLIFDPTQRGTEAASIFREAAERRGWILMSSNQTRSDEFDEADRKRNRAAIRALWAEAHTRFSTDHRRIYASGWSGGAMFSIQLGARVQLAGVIGCGGRLVGDELKNAKYPHFGAAGMTDFNYIPMRKIDEQFAKNRAPHRFESFEGGHQWMPRALAAAAIDWMDIVAMRDGVLAHDDALIDATLQSGIERAGVLEKQNKLPEAIRQLVWMSETFDGLRPVAELRARIEHLEADPRIPQIRAAEKRAFEFEERTLDRISTTLAGVGKAEMLPAVGKVVSDLQIAHLRAQADKGSFEGDAAKRVLASLMGELAFYRYREVVAEKNLSMAILLLSVAEQVEPRSIGVKYNLACTYVRRGERKRALAALRRAVDSGFRNAERMQTDEALAPLRGEPEFQALLRTVEERARSAAR